ncbi:MAG: non-homologous end-joining DNA ligase [Thermoanaerobaculia bacterium]
MSAAKGSATATVAGVELTHPDRVLFGGQGVTKKRLAEYYAAVEERIFPHLEGRPVSLVRCPEGAGEECFYQKHPGAGLDTAIDAVELAEKEGAGLYLVVREPSDVIVLVQYGALEIHPWNCLADRPERPDRLIFDLDPGPDVAWDAVRQAARDVRRRLDTLGLESFLRTSGGKGLHVVAPLVRRNSWDEIHEFAKAVAASLVAEEPDAYTMQAAKGKRAGKVFLDYLRNSRGATAVATYSTRARDGAPVATPLAWEELDEVSGGGACGLDEVDERMSRDEAWDGFFSLQQSVSAARLRQARAAAGWAFMDTEE